MFSINAGILFPPHIGYVSYLTGKHEGHQLQVPTLCQAGRFWKYSSQGQLIIKFLSSLDKSEPLNDNTTNNNLQLAELSEHYHGDRFMDAGNDRLFDIDFTKEAIAQTDPYDIGRDIGLADLSCFKFVFLSNLKDVDFDVALPGLDYLQHLECTRRDTLQEAAKKLGITEENWQRVLADKPNALAWVKDIERKSKELELCYADLYLGLRIWVSLSGLPV